MIPSKFKAITNRDIIGAIIQAAAKNNIPNIHTNPQLLDALTAAFAAGYNHRQNYVKHFPSRQSAAEVWAQACAAPPLEGQSEHYDAGTHMASKAGA